MVLHCMQEHCMARRGVERGVARRAKQLDKVAHGYHCVRILALAPVTRRRCRARPLEVLEVGPATVKRVDGVVVVALALSVTEKIFVRVRCLRRRGIVVLGHGAVRGLACRAPETTTVGRSGVPGRRRRPSTGALERQVGRRARQLGLAR